MAVGQFTAAPGVSNDALSLRGANSIKGGGADGTFSGYLHDAVVSELKTAGRYDPHSNLVLSGMLTRNSVSTGMSKGSTTVSARFRLSQNGQMCFEKSLLARTQWPSSFVGAIAIPNAISNYPAVYQKLLGDLFTDPQFMAALRKSSASP